MINEIKTILGDSEGGRLITGTTEVNGNWVAIVVNADVVFSELEVNGVNVLASRGFTGNVITAGMYIGSGYHYAPNRSKFTKIKLASGSVMAY